MPQGHADARECNLRAFGASSVPCGSLRSTRGALRCARGRAGARKCNPSACGAPTVPCGSLRTTPRRPAVPSGARRRAEVQHERLRRPFAGIRKPPLNMQIWGGARTFHTSVLTLFHLRASVLAPRRGPAPILQACARERMITPKLLLECAGAVSHETSLPECAAHKCTETTDVDARARDFYSHYPFERAGTASRPNFFIWAAQNFGALRCHAVAIGLP